MSRFEVKILIFEIRNCDGREREKRQHNRCELGRGGGARHRSALAAPADADLAGLGLRRVKLILMLRRLQDVEKVAEKDKVFNESQTLPREQLLSGIL